jgi:hypothetical protein
LGLHDAHDLPAAALQARLPGPLVHSVAELKVPRLVARNAVGAVAQGRALVLNCRVQHFPHFRVQPQPLPGMDAVAGDCRMEPSTMEDL